MEIMRVKNLTPGTVCHRTGFFEKFFYWIIESGNASVDAMERIADSIGVGVEEIVLPDISGNMENVIEFIKDRDRATVSFSQGRYVSRIKKLAAEHPGKCEIVAENKDGSICAHVPVAWVRISPPAVRSEEQREQARARMKNYHAEHVRVTHEIE